MKILKGMFRLLFVVVLMVSFTACIDMGDDEKYEKTFEGSLEVPVELTLSLVHSAKIGSEHEENRSYYTFVTGAIAQSYTITASNLTAPADLEFYLHSDISTYIDGAYNISKTGETFVTIELSANTRYYLEVYNYISNEDITFDLLVAP